MPLNPFTIFKVFCHTCHFLTHTCHVLTPYVSLSETPVTLTPHVSLPDTTPTTTPVTLWYHTCHSLTQHLTLHLPPQLPLWHHHTCHYTWLHSCHSDTTHVIFWHHACKLLGMEWARNSFSYILHAESNWQQGFPHLWKVTDNTCFNVMTQWVQFFPGHPTHQIW